MSILKANKTISNLLKKGFIKYENDHHFFEFWYNGNLVLKTKTSHNNQDIGDTLISTMCKQCKVSKEFFIKFARCEKSKDDYVAELKLRNIIE